MTEYGPWPTAQGNILENIELIENLEETKRTAVEIEEKVKLAKQTEIQIAKAREVYRPVATRGSLVYFLIDNLNALDRVYHYSMANFVYVLKKGMDVTPGGKDESKVGSCACVLSSGLGWAVLDTLTLRAPVKDAHSACRAPRPFPTEHVALAALRCGHRWRLPSGWARRWTWTSAWSCWWRPPPTCSSHTWRRWGDSSQYHKPSKQIGQRALA